MPAKPAGPNPEVSNGVSKIRQSFLQRLFGDQAARDDTGNGHPHGHVLLLGMRSAKPDFIGGRNFRLRAQRRQIIYDLVNTAVDGYRNGDPAIGFSVTRWLPQFHLSNLEWRSLFPGHSLQHLEKLGLRLLGGIARNQPFLAAGELDGSLL